MADEPLDNVIAVSFAIDSAKEVPAISPSIGKSGANTRTPFVNGPTAAGVGLPDGCPVIPLGKRGGICFYLDDLKQLREVPATGHQRLGLEELYGRKNHLLQEYWPRTDKHGNIIGCDCDAASKAMMASAAAKGVWNPSERVRGRGAWVGDDGQLVLHCGDKILEGVKWLEPGLVGRYVYPADPPIIAPYNTSVPGGDRGAARETLTLLESWNWRRNDLDALLLLGWIGAAMLGGAIEWRPVTWITGGPGTGKSTLHKLLTRLFDGALISVSDSSAAGIWQKLGHATLPVALDELEAEEDGRKAQANIKLIRQAASGGLVLRGGANHTGAEFTARSCFLCSSVLLPPLGRADRSRIAVLELNELKGQKPPELPPNAMKELGAKLLKRLVDGWSRWGDTLELYRSALGAVGHSARGADVFGTMLAAADLMLHDAEPNADHAASLAEQFSAAGMADSDDEAGDHEHCLQHIISSPLPPDGGANKRSVAELARRICEGAPYDVVVDEAVALLGTYGLKVYREKNGAWYFAVANDHRGLARLFDGTHWAHKSGGSSVWKQTLRRHAGAVPSDRPIRFSGAQSRATLIPVGFVVSVDERGEPRARAADHLTLDT